MNIYAILCHKLTNSLIFTVKSLAETYEDKIIIHVDNKTERQEFDSIKMEFFPLENVIFTNDRINVFWGDDSQIHAILELMRKAQEFDFKYFSLISGDDIPITSINYRNSFLNDSYNKRIEFIGFNPVHNGLERLSYNYPRFFFEKSKTPIVKLKKFIFRIFLKRLFVRKTTLVSEIHKGSIWFTITSSCICYIINYLKINGSYLSFFRDSFCADEIFFHTIILNSTYAKNIYMIDHHIEDCERGLRYIDWISGPEYPKILNADDLKGLEVRNSIFARKIDPKLTLNQLELIHKNLSSTKDY